MLRAYLFAFSAFNAVGSLSALDRLPYQNWFVELSTDLINLAALYCGVVVVEVVELYLYDLYLRVFRKDLLKYLCGIVERNAEVLYLALCFEFQSRFIGFARLEFRVIACTLSVHKVKVKIIHAAPFQLILKERPYILLLAEIAVCKLVGQYVAFTRIAACKAGTYRSFALPADISVGGVKVVEALFNEAVYHFSELRLIDFAVCHRQTHTAECKLFIYVVHGEPP